MRVHALAVMLICLPLVAPSAAVYVVNPQGTGDFETIQDAVDAAETGDIIELTGGTFTGPGNRNLDFLGKAITLRSQCGDPEDVIIDCQSLCPALRFQTGEQHDTMVRGITVTRGFAPERGGAIQCVESSPRIQNCRFVENTSVVTGGAIHCNSGSPGITHCEFTQNTSGRGGALSCEGESAPILTDCTFEANHGIVHGGAIYFYGLTWYEAYPKLQRVTFKQNTCNETGGAMVTIWSSPTVLECAFIDNEAGINAGAAWVGGEDAHPTFERCTITGNAGSTAGSFYCNAACTLTMMNSIISFGPSGAPVWCADGSIATLTCCNVYGNAGGDWTQGIEGQHGVDGNISEDPLYCFPEQGNYRLRSESPCAPFTPPNPECDLIGAFPAGCVDVVVRPDGLGDYPTIQAAVDAEDSGSSIGLDSGIFVGEGNRDIDFQGKALILMSIAEEADSCIIDCEGTEADPHRAFVFQAGEGTDSQVRGITIRNGYAPGAPARGGAILCDGTSPAFMDCAFEACQADWGGGVSAQGGSPSFTGCEFVGNIAAAFGGGFHSSNLAQPTISGCTFWGNGAVEGGGLYFDRSLPAISSCTLHANAASGAAEAASGIQCSNYASVALEHTIISFGTGGMAIHCGSNAQASLACCDLFGNEGGDWVGAIADQAGENGNMSYDPQYCDAGAGDLHLWSYSPCDLTECDLIGAWPVGCWDAQGVEDNRHEARGGIRALASSPDPFGRRTTISFALNEGGPVDLRIHDVSGRLVRILEQGSRSAGAHAVVWDGRDAHGQPLQSGVYYCRLRVDSESAVHRVVMIR